MAVLERSLSFVRWIGSPRCCGFTALYCSETSCVVFFGRLGGNTIMWCIVTKPSSCDFDEDGIYSYIHPMCMGNCNAYLYPLTQSFLRLFYSTLQWGSPPPSPSYVCFIPLCSGVVPHLSPPMFVLFHSVAGRSPTMPLLCLFYFTLQWGGCLPPGVSRNLSHLSDMVKNWRTENASCRYGKEKQYNQKSIPPLYICSFVGLSGYRFAHRRSETTTKRWR